MIKKQSAKTITINGLIIPDRWDEDGNITGIAIAGFDESNHSILMDRVGKGLLKFMNDKVIITGNIFELDNTDVIKVTAFS